MNKLLFLLLSCFSYFTLNSQIDIAEARSMSEGSIVTIEGIATNGSSLGIIRYVQDETGAIAVYPGTGSVGDFPDDVTEGDLVQVTGELKEFNGLLEVDAISNYEVISSGNVLPTPLEVSPAGINESTEAQLLKVNGVSFSAGGNNFSVGNYEFTVGGESGEIYVRSNHPLIGTEIPLATVNLTGIASQFNSIYQLLPRGPEDLEIADDFYLTKSPSQSNLSTTGFTVSWETSDPATSKVNFGTGENLDQSVEDATLKTSHSIELTGLEPAEFYNVEVVSNNGTSEVISMRQIYATGSTSSGVINTYFTFDVDGSFSEGSYPTDISGAAIEGEIIKRINAAQTSIDCAIYNINRTTIVNALTDAHERGVIVRYIADNGTANLALSDPTPPFGIIRGNADGLMHNKFFVFDAEDNDNAWVMSGSTNLTEQNLVLDYNNTVFIQDKALAKAYTIEFEEMWGTDGPDPGVFTVAFGSDKTNNTPHTFLVNGIIMESYFSPSDNTTIAIANAIKSADTDVQFALLTFTNNELGTTILNAHNNGIEVRGIIDNINDQGSEFEYLTNNNVNVTMDNTTASTHHKYCIIDATNPSSDPQVVIGSHNWSAGAETRNDENTLIVHDANLTNVYLQEFEARWCETQGQSNCTTSIDEDSFINGVELNLFPNPTSYVANVNISLERQADVTISILDTRGIFLQSSVLQNVFGALTKSIDLSSYPAGQYIMQLTVGKERMARVLQVVK